MGDHGTARHKGGRPRAEDHDPQRQEDAPLIANGKDVGDPEGKSVASWLSDNGYDVPKTAVLLNGKIVPRDRMESTALKESDTIEIVSFVGGG
ncbi:sulfur carrier protein ThiS [Methanomethylophilus alvi]|uniref:sulfur carrier protein ThiS n=1 Tax=Methanomethylophilus alvi TaxID=1291540 RepID=UPI0037DC0A7C